MTAFLDDRGRLFGRVNIIDLLVVLLLLALIVFAFVRFGSSDEETTVRATLVVEEVRSATVEQIERQFEMGNPVHAEGGILLGELVEVEETPTLVEVPTAEGRLVEAESPIYSDIILVVEGTGHSSGESIRVGNLPMRVGQRLVLVGPGYEVRVQVRGVETVGG